MGMKKPAGVICTMHRLTWEGLAKCPLCEGFRANGAKPSEVKPTRRFAFTAAFVPAVGVKTSTGYLPGPPLGHGFMVGRADEGADGWTPIPALGVFETYEKATKRAAVLNGALGLDTKEAAAIVDGTMRTGSLKRAHAATLRVLKQLLDAPDDEDTDNERDAAREELENNAKLMEGYGEGL